jgi:membrane protein required for colicin V production
MLQWVDIAIIVIIGLSVLTGLFRGFIKELVSLCVWVIAIWLGMNYSSQLDPLLQSYIKESSIRSAVSFIIILFGTLFVGGIVNALLSFILKRAGLSGTDRTLGMGFGFLRGVFIVSLIILVMQMTSVPYQSYAEHSSLFPRFTPLVSLLKAHLPDLVKEGQFGNKTEQGMLEPLKTIPTGDERNEA